MMDAVAIVRLSRFLCHVFFSRVRVLNQELIPSTGAVVLVANHHSALIDPMVLLAVLDRTPRFMAKAVLWTWKYLPLHPFLRMARAVPVHRVKDGGGDNSSMFSSTRDVLSDGGVIAVFGEGVSHDTAGLKDLRTGPARIAMGTPAEVSLVPIGIVYPDRPTYRSTVTIEVGEPIIVNGSVGGDEDRVGVQALTAQLTEAMRTVAPTWEREEDQMAAAAAAKVVATRESTEQGAVQNRINRAVDRNDPAAADVLNAAKDLLDECEHLDIPLDHVVEEPANLGTMARSSHLRAILWAVPTIIGHVLNYPPYSAVDLLAKRNDYNFQATAKVLAGVVLYPMWWMILFIGSWWQWSFGIGLVVLVAAVVGGYIAGAKMRLLKRSNTRMTAEENDTDLSGLEQRFNAVVAAVDRLPA